MEGFKMIDYSEQFDKERKYRVEVSYHKYGSARKNFGEGRVDEIATAERCIEAFKKDHNTEHLVDAANYLMFRFMYPMPGEYFRPTDSSGSVGTVGTPINMERDD
jgi:histidinol dehydrogenase